MVHKALLKLVKFSVFTLLYISQQLVVAQSLSISNDDVSCLFNRYTILDNKKIVQYLNKDFHRNAPSINLGILGEYSYNISIYDTAFNIQYTNTLPSYFGRRITSSTSPAIIDNLVFLPLSYETLFDIYLPCSQDSFGIITKEPISSRPFMFVVNLQNIDTASIPFYRNMYECESSIIHNVVPYNNFIRATVHTNLLYDNYSMNLLKHFSISKALVTQQLDSIKMDVAYQIINCIDQKNEQEKCFYKNQSQRKLLILNYRYETGTYDSLIYPYPNNYLFSKSQKISNTEFLIEFTDFSKKEYQYWIFDENGIYKILNYTSRIKRMVHTNNWYLVDFYTNQEDFYTSELQLLDHDFKTIGTLHYDYENNIAGGIVHTGNNIDAVTIGDAGVEVNANQMFFKINPFSTLEKMFSLEHGTMWSISPTLCFDYLSIHAASEVNYTIYAASGAAVMQGNERIINIKNLANGVYFMKLKGATTTQKFVKN